jgi:2-isopropylmalate synthase
MTGDRRIWLFDTTLRDGNQTQGVDFGVSDKIAIAQALDALGIEYVEGGWPGANPTDDAFFGAPPRLKRARLTAFGMTRRSGRSAANDPGLAVTLRSKVDTICLVGKTHDVHVRVALGVDLDENVAMIADSIAEVVRRGKEALFDAEHFFDGYKADPGYALKCLDAAIEAGARWVVLCDTNGGALPDEVEAITTEVARRLPGERLGIHTHNDTENAVANSLAAVRAGVRQVQGTLNGLGERCGNANLISLLPTLVLKMGYETGVSEEGLARLTEVSHMLDERLNQAPDRHAPYVGASAFAHKAGLHVSAVEKEPSLYEHIAPETVGNRRRILVSDQSGRANILSRFRELGIEVDAADDRIARLVEEVKEREFQGYAYDGAAASFELIARRLMHAVPDYFALDSFRVIDERRYNARGDLVTLSEATVKVAVGHDRMMTVAEGNGPVNALDFALRKALRSAYPELERVRLVDYKVRILTPGDGTAAVTRVLIESADGDDERWTTVGVSGNIINASYEALYDGLTWFLHRAGRTAPTA